MKISACVITKNEECNIERNINSYKASVDEIIVVDTGSTDNTVEIAKNLGAIVYHFEWIDDFAAAKNYALNKATGDWIIFMDADEFFSEKTSMKLRSYIKKYNDYPNINMILIPSVNITLKESSKDKLSHINKDDFTIINKQFSLRIFRKISGLQYVGAAHEILTVYGQYTEHTFDDNLLIYHTGYATDEILKDKIKRNIEILLQNNNNSGFIRDYNIAKSYYGLEQYEETLKYIRPYLFNNEIILPGELYFPINLFFSAKISLEAYDNEYCSILKKAENNYVEYPMIPYFAARFAISQNQYQKAIDYLNMAIELDNKYSDKLNINVFSSQLQIVYILYGMLYEKKGDFGKAANSYLTSLKYNKKNSSALITYFRLYRLSENSYTDIIKNLEQIYDISSANDLQQIISSIPVLHNNEVFNYYYENFYNKIKQRDNSFILLLLANRKYNDAFIFLKELYDNKVLFGNLKDIYDSELAFAALLSSDIKNIEYAISHIGKSHSQVLSAFMLQNATLQDNVFDEYMHLTRLFVNFTNESMTELILKLPNNFNSRNINKLTEFLSSEGLYSLSFEQYCKILEFPCNAITKASTFLELGKINYLSNEYDDAYAYFEDAKNCIDTYLKSNYKKETVNTNLLEDKFNLIINELMEYTSWLRAKKY